MPEEIIVRGTPIKQKDIKGRFIKGMISWAKGRKLTVEEKERISKTMKGKTPKNFALLSTPECIKKSLLRKEMSGLEKRVNQVILDHKLSYKFVGNGKFLIENKNPDFVNTNGEKIAVEVYNREHKEKFRKGLQIWKKNRQKLFQKYGWETIFIEEWQTNREKDILALL